MFSIAIHEIGHLVPAKKFGVKVSQYMIGFGPTLWSKVRGETEYGIKAIPLVGFIRILGMFPPRKGGPLSEEELEILRESRTWKARMTVLIEQSRAEALSELNEAEQDRAFYRLSAPKKIVVMFGGPFMNLVLASILFAIALSGIGESQITTKISGVVPCIPSKENPEGISSVDGGCGAGVHTPAHKLGLQAGDIIEEINGKPIVNWEDISLSLNNTAGNSVLIKFVRNGQQSSGRVEIAAYDRPIYDEQGKATDATERVSFLGVQPQFEYVTDPISTVPGFIWQQSVDVVKAIAGFPAGVVDVGDSLVTDAPRDEDGFVSIIGVGQMSSSLASSTDVTLKDKVSSFIWLMASLNMFLFLFNLVPILPLDGGHIAGAIYEGLRKVLARLRRKPDPGPVDTAKMMPVAYVAGVFLISMSLVVMLADIFKPISF